MKQKTAFLASFFLVFAFCFLLPYPNPALSAEQVILTASIDPTVQDADIKITGVPDTSTTLSQNQEVTITLSYRHSAGGSYPFQISGAWEKGLISGTSSNYIDIFDYVVGSATQADDGTIPVVDPVNKKITWNIPALSGSINYHTVSFKLKVRGDIPTDNEITALVKTQAKLAGATLPEKSLSYTIKKSHIASTVTPTPSAIPSPVPTGRPVIPTRVPLRINYVRINEIADTYLTIIFQTNKESAYTLSYGENPTSLSKNVTGLTTQLHNTVKLSELKPKTQYYFRITARDQQGSAVTSDLFTGTTASGKETIKLSRDDFTIHWKNYFLLSDVIDSVVVPKSKPLTVTARINDSANISKIKALFVNENVLGINTLAPLANIGETPLIEILPSVFSGEIQSPAQKGQYAIAFEITDVNGGIYKKQAPYKFYVSDPLRVIDKRTKKPIENAEVKIIKYQDSLKLFAPLENSFAVVTHTDESGDLDIVLPTGIYEIEVKSPHYKSASTTVELGISTIEYPIFELEPETTIAGKISYYRDAIADLSTFTAGAARNIFSSQRAKDLFLFFTCLLLLLLIVLDTHIKKRVGVMRKIITLSILDVLVVFTGVGSLLFIKYLGASETALLLASTLFIFLLGIIYVKKAFFGKKN